MDRSISTHDAAACAALVDECCELWADASLWQDHLTSGTEHLIGGAVSVCAITAIGPHGPLMIEGHIPKATGSRLRARWNQYVADGGTSLLPEVPLIVPALVRDGSITYQQLDLIDRRTYFASEFYERYWADEKLGNGLIAVRVIDRGLVFGLAVHRRSGERVFSSRDLAVIDLLALLLSRRLGRPLQSSASHSTHSLAPRQRQVLAALLEGSSEKQIAHRLGISRATTHEYIVALYRRFGVHTRGQLMASFLRQASPLLASKLLDQAAADRRAEGPDHHTPDD